MIICGRCGQENPAGFRLCGMCGAALEAESAREVRKTVTVLFADLSGSTAFGERLDPEALRRTMSRYRGSSVAQPGRTATVDQASGAKALLTLLDRFGLEAEPGFRHPPGRAGLVCRDGREDR